MTAEEQHRALLNDVVAQAHDYPAERFDGRGIVVCAGGPRLLTCAYVLVSVLRRTLACRLPIELWHLGADELGPVEEALFADLDVTAVDALEVRKERPVRTLGGWELKPYAVANSRFAEVLLLDADNVPVADPMVLFDSPQFAEAGAIFWPDVERIAPDNPIWSLCGVEYARGVAFESGQALFDKARCWHALQVALHMNEHSDFYFDYIHGDKDTYLLAWLLTGAPYAMPKRLPKVIARTIYQHDFDDRIVFQHRNRAKWVLRGRNWREPGFVHEQDCLVYLEELARVWDGTISHLPSRSDADVALERELAEQRWFDYERVGSETRTLELATGNRVLTGRSGREQVWYVQDGELVLASYRDPTVRLAHSGGTWTGTWVVDEQFEVVLSPAVDPGTQHGRPVFSGVRNPGLRLEGADTRWRYDFVGTFNDEEAKLAPATAVETPRVLVLTPVKDAAGHLDTYFAALDRLDYPRDLLSLGFLESDSADGTYEALQQRLPELEASYRCVTLRKKDFGFRLPDDVPRWAPEWQLARRQVMAKGRNQLLFAALADEHWVLWLDVDVIEYPADIVQRLLATGRSIVQPHCVQEYGGPTFDRNGWRDRGEVHLDDLRGGDDLVRLDSVGGTMLLVDAEAHRNGLVFPAVPYVGEHRLARQPHPAFGGVGEIETEGLGLLAADMGYECWGMPNLEVLHAAR